MVVAALTMSAFIFPELLLGPLFGGKPSSFSKRDVTARGASSKPENQFQPPKARVTVESDDDDRDRARAAFSEARRCGMVVVCSDDLVAGSFERPTHLTVVGWCSEDQNAGLSSLLRLSVVVVEPDGQW